MALIFLLIVGKIFGEKKSLPNDEQPSQLLIVTVATEETDGLKRLQSSAKEFGHNLEVFGLGEKWDGGNMHLGTVRFC